MRLTRADLGWKSLLFALSQLPDQPAIAPRSALMEGQGFGVIRRDEGRTYVALDYGHTGGGHGHPDRLNLWLVQDEDRVFEDVGTGSYVERTLHWYRSTLAHNAPLVDGRSQDPVAGSLKAWAGHDSYAWIDAEAAIAHGVLVRRSVVVAAGYVIDRVEWRSDRVVRFDLPMHIDGEVQGAVWTSAPLGGANGLEDGFDFVTASEEWRSGSSSGSQAAVITARSVTGRAFVFGPHSWWRATAPGAPGQSERRFLLARATAATGKVISVWSWAGDVDAELTDDGTLTVQTRQGRVEHGFSGDVWRVQSDSHEIVLDGRRPSAILRGFAPRQSFMRTVPVIPLVSTENLTIGTLTSGASGLRFDLAERHYRRTESTWRDAGAPRTTVVIGATPNELLVEVSVLNPEPNFMPQQSENALDNEHPDTNSDGIQLHVAFAHLDGRRRYASWLLVPDINSPEPRLSRRGDAVSLPLAVTWRRTNDGWQVLCKLPRASMGTPDAEIALDVIVNEMPSTRERRRGQLVMSAKSPGWAYLRGDRQDIDQLIPMTFENV